MSVIARVSMIIADAIVITATWLRMHRQAKEALTVRIHSSLSTVMLTDGPCAFVVDDRSGLPMYSRQFVFPVSDICLADLTVSSSVIQELTSFEGRCLCSTSVSSSTASRYVTHIALWPKTTLLNSRPQPHSLFSATSSLSLMYVSRYSRRTVFERSSTYETTSAPMILISRFILNLRRADQRNRSVESRFSRFAPSELLVTSHFDQIVEEMGQPLLYDVDAAEEYLVDHEGEGSEAVLAQASREQERL